MWDYKSLRSAIMICATLVSTQTHIQPTELKTEPRYVAIERHKYIRGVKS